MSENFKRTDKRGKLNARGKSKRGNGLKKWQDIQRNGEDVQSVKQHASVQLVGEDSTSGHQLEAQEVGRTSTPILSNDSAGAIFPDRADISEIYLQSVSNNDEYSNVDEIEQNKRRTPAVTPISSTTGISLDHINYDGNTQDDEERKTTSTTSQPTTPKIDNDSNSEPYEVIYNCSGDDNSPVIGEGCRVYDNLFLFEQMSEMNNHNSPTQCNFTNMRMIKEKRNGVSSIFTFECLVCNIKMKLYTHRYMKYKKPKEHGCQEMNPNEAAVAATILAGVGQIVFDRIFSALNIPTMGSATYAKYRTLVAKNLHEIAIEDMRRSAEKAANLARQRGDVTADGIPMIPVIIDGVWCRRSYRNNYNSLGGCGVIIAAETGEVIYIAVMNKFCVICAKAHNRNEPAKEHVCFKNWPADKSSASMEAAAIVQGFLSSVAMYGLIYHKVVADGDSSVYRCILEADPYEEVKVQKIECKNHLLKNFCANIQAECHTTSEGKRDLVALKKFVSGKVLQLRCGIVKAIEYRSQQGVTMEASLALAGDILNAPSHIFGEHQKCAEIKYFCDGNKKDGEVDMVPDLIKSGLYKVVMERCNILAGHSRSLLHNITTNAVESFNAIIASKISGKRINYTGRDSYQARVCAAVSHHIDGEAFRKLHKKSVKCSPALYSKRNEQSLQRIRIKQRKRCKRRQLFQNNKNQNDYGPNITVPDMSAEDYQVAQKVFLEKIQQQNSQITKIELETRDQQNSDTWRRVRKSLLTASNVGKICRMKEQTSTAATIESMLYSTFDNDAVEWGREHESIAKEVAEKHLNLEIEECGLFIHPEYFYIGASPDGKIGDNAVVEVKCPYTARNMTVSEGVKSKKIKFLDKNLELKKIHPYYYQIQCQLEVTNREHCFFIVWTKPETIILTIKRDKEFWTNEMVPKMKKFYFNCLLPELVNSRKKRSLPMRNINIDGQTVEKMKKSGKKEIKKKTPVARKELKKKTPVVRNQRGRRKKNEKPDSQNLLVIKNNNSNNEFNNPSTTQSILSLKKDEGKEIPEKPDASALPGSSSGIIQCSTTNISNDPEKILSKPSNLGRKRKIGRPTSSAPPKKQKRIKCK